MASSKSQTSSSIDMFYIEDLIDLTPEPTTETDTSKSYSSDDGLSNFLNELQQSTNYEFYIEDLPDLTPEPTTETDTSKMSNRTNKLPTTMITTMTSPMVCHYLTQICKFNILCQRYHFCQKHHHHQYR